MAEDSSNLTEFEPHASQAPVPIPFCVAFFVLIYLATLYLDSNAGGFHARVYEPFASHDVLAAAQPQKNVDPRFEKGRKAYAKYCAPCHQNNGAGSPGQYPPLAGSDWVNDESPNRVLRVILNGLTGPITVSGVQWNTSVQMMPWRDTIEDDEELASLATYIRGQSEWGNEADPVTDEQVKAIRAETAGRTLPWTQPELFQMPNP